MPVIARLALALALLPAVAGAETKLEPWQVIGTVTAEWNGDGLQDRAILSYDPDGMITNLSIYFGTREGGFKPDTELVDEVWMGSMWGMQPDLSLKDDGTLVVASRNIGMGRNRWENTIDVAYRNGVFVVTGFATSYYDTLDLQGGGDCTVDFAAGRGTFTDVEGRETPFETAGGVIPLLKWSYVDAPSACWPE